MKFIYFQYPHLIFNLPSTNYANLRLRVQVPVPVPTYCTINWHGLIQTHGTLWTHMKRFSTSTTMPRSRSSSSSLTCSRWDTWARSSWLQALGRERKLGLWAATFRVNTSSLWAPAKAIGLTIETRIFYLCTGTSLWWPKMLSLIPSNSEYYPHPESLPVLFFSSVNLI